MCTFSPIIFFYYSWGCCRIFCVARQRPFVCLCSKKRFWGSSIIWVDARTGNIWLVWSIQFILLFLLGGWCFYSPLKQCLQIIQHIFQLVWYLHFSDNVMMSPLWIIVYLNKSGVLQRMWLAIHVRFLLVVTLWNAYFSWVVLHILLLLGHLKHVDFISRLHVHSGIL